MSESRPSVNEPKEGTMTTTFDLDALVLAEGAHDNPDDGMCVMEAVAYIAGEPFSDHPACASTVVGAFLRAWNDALPDSDRQQLKRYISRLVGSKGTADQEDERAWMALDWLVRSYTPVWLRVAGLHDQAGRMEGLPEFKAGMDVPSVRPVIDAVRKDARDAAVAAAGAAAVAAAVAAAGAAARAAARDAARDALAASVTTCQESAHGLVDLMLKVTGS